MDLNLTADEKLFRDELRSWLAANAPKDWPAWQNKPLEESYPYLRAWQRKLYEAGWAECMPTERVQTQEYPKLGIDRNQMGQYWWDLHHINS